MIKKILWAIGTVSVLAAAFLYYHGLQFNRYVRNSTIGNGKTMLRQAAQELARNGSLTNALFRPTYTHTLVQSTNSIAVIDGKRYDCYLILTQAMTAKEGYLGITTNDTFIWFDNKHGPKLIYPGYQSTSLSKL